MRFFADNADLKQPLAKHATQPNGTVEWGIRSRIDGTHKGPMPESEARDWAAKFPQSYVPVSRFVESWKAVE